jgi:hypothetical protein
MSGPKERFVVTADRIGLMIERNNCRLCAQKNRDVILNSIMDQAMAATKLVRLKQQVAATSRTANDARPRGIHSDFEAGLAYPTRPTVRGKSLCNRPKAGVQILNATILSGQLISIPGAS